MTESAPTLDRRLGLAHLVLYGLGVTVGAGIYVLVGLTVAEAGLYAPMAFLLAAFVVSFTGLSYAELATRFPVSAGEAVYVEEGLRWRKLALAVGLLTAASGLVSSATIAIGASAYLGELVPLDTRLLAAMTILALGALTAWGILQSVSFAAVLTVVEVAGLFVVIYFATCLNPGWIGRTPTLLPPFEAAAWSGIGAAGLLAFFAFIGFEDLANIAEEARDPRRNMPRAILLTLIVATMLYLLVVSAVVLSVPRDEVAGSAAPLMRVFRDAPPSARIAFNTLAAFATINGILVQMIMSSRILYGMARREHLPAWLGTVSARTRTPLNATAFVTAIILALALLVPIARLAEVTSQLALFVFACVNASLLAIKRRGYDPDAFSVPSVVPALGLVTCVALLVGGVFLGR